MKAVSISPLAFVLMCVVAIVAAVAGASLGEVWTVRWLLAAAGLLVLAGTATGVLRWRLRAESARVERMIAEPSSSNELGVEFAGVSGQLRQRQAEFERQLATSDESRHQLEVLLEGMQDAVLGVDAAGRVQWTNAQMTRVMETHGAGGAVRLGRSVAHTLRDPVLRGAVRQAVEERIASEVRSPTLLPGRIFDVNATPLPGGGAVVVLRDVTRAEAVERTQREFVANVSHELRTPLTSIVGYVETLLDTEPLESNAREYLETVLKNASRMSRLTEDLLVLARVENTDQSLRLQTVAADGLLREAILVAESAPFGEYAAFELERSTAAAVFADEHAIGQVLGNLMENAVKYGGGGRAARARVVLAAVVRDENRTVEFTVRDFGAGIAQEHQDRIFERFYRVDKARSRESGGTGLGLAIARHLIEEQGGTLRVTSALGEGSTFTFTLSLAD